MGNNIMNETDKENLTKYIENSVALNPDASLIRSLTGACEFFGIILTETEFFDFLHDYVWSK